MRCKAVRFFPYFLVLALLELSCLGAYGQGKGWVNGQILDAYGEPLIGATAVQKSLFVGVSTDMNGAFSLALPAGTYEVEFAYMGYETQLVEGVQVVAGQATPLTVTLRPSSVALEEVVVRASYTQSSAAGALSIQQHMPQVSAVMAAEQISRTPDKNLGEALRRVTGVSTVGNKFVTVRGMGERWNEASLDGIVLPSTETNSKAFSFDLVPTSLIDNVTVIKTPSPDITSNFSGALIQITTKDIPNNDFVNVSAGLSFNLQSTFREQQGRHRPVADWFGADVGSRDMPVVLVSIPWSERNPRPETFAQSRLFTRDNFSLHRSLTPPSPNYQVSLGQNHRLGSEAQERFKLKTL